MIDIDSFYREFGSDRSLGSDEHMMLDGQVRVLCAQDAVTAIFESLNTGEDKLDAMFEICRRQGGVLPFTTRSGHLALRIASEGTADETASALKRLKGVMDHLRIGQ
jgi:hypothetical protein